MKDNSDYYVITGVIIHETDIYPVEGATQTYKYRFEEFNQAEIHVHDIFKGQNEFSRLTLARKYEILGHLYNMIDPSHNGYFCRNRQGGDSFQISAMGYLHGRVDFPYRAVR